VRSETSRGVCNRATVEARTVDPRNDFRVGVSEMLIRHPHV
jgi:hypothetical protein